MARKKKAESAAADTLALGATPEARAAKLQAAIDLTRGKYGKDAISTLRGPEAAVDVEDVDFISTGSLTADLMLGGRGLPRGRITEVYGAEGSGKTTLALQLIAECQKAGGVACFIDAEHALNPDYAAALGVDLEELLLVQPQSAENALDILETLLRNGSVDLIIVDSVAALTPQAELDADMGDSLPGLQARLMSQAMRKLAPFVRSANALVLFINQIRMKIGVMFGSPKTTSGGNALKFYSSVRIEITRIGAVKKGEEVLGNKTKMKVVKNKLFPPFRACEVNLIYGKGFDTRGEMLDLGVSCGIVVKKGGWFQVKGDEKNLAQGRDNAAAALAKRPEVLKQIEEAVRNTHVSRIDEEAADASS